MSSKIELMNWNCTCEYSFVWFYSKLRRHSLTSSTEHRLVSGIYESKLRKYWYLSYLPTSNFETDRSWNFWNQTFNNGYFTSESNVRCTLNFLPYPISSQKYLGSAHRWRGFPWLPPRTHNGGLSRHPVRFWWRSWFLQWRRNPFMDVQHQGERGTLTLESLFGTCYFPPSFPSQRIPELIGNPCLSSLSNCTTRRVHL